MKTQSTFTFLDISMWDTKTRDISIPPNQTYELKIDYPLSIVATCPIKTGANGLHTAGIISKIAKFYRKIYDNEEKFGIWGHCMEDLTLGHIRIDHKKKEVTISVGS